MPTPNPSIEPHPQASFACLRMRLMSNVEAVGKPPFEKQPDFHEKFGLSESRIRHDLAFGNG